MTYDELLHITVGKWMIGPNPEAGKGGVLTEEPVEDDWPQEVKFWKYLTTGINKAWESDLLLTVTGNDINPLSLCINTH